MKGLMIVVSVLALVGCVSPYKESTGTYIKTAHTEFRSPFGTNNSFAKLQRCKGPEYMVLFYTEGDFKDCQDLSAGELYVWQHGPEEMLQQAQGLSRFNPRLWQYHEGIGGEVMNEFKKLMVKWAKEDRAFLESIDRRKWYGRGIIIALFLIVVLMVGIGNAPHTAVEVPVYDATLMQRYQVELDLTRKQRDDYKKQAEVVKKLLLASNTKITQYEQHLKALAESVPSQSVILEAVKREAVTENGLRQVVARNFGSEIARRITITGGE